MVIDQAEIDALLKQGAAEAAPPSKPPPPRPARLATNCDPKLAQILRLKAPVIVEVARRRWPIQMLRNLSLGMIIEFEKSVEEPMQLRINNRVIGAGEAVKIGEHFGLRVSTVRDQAERIRSMGE